MMNMNPSTYEIARMTHEERAAKGERAYRIKQVLKADPRPAAAPRERRSFIRALFSRPSEA